MPKFHTPLLVGYVSFLLAGAFSNAQAACQVYTGELEYNYEGYPIVYELAVYKILDEKKYIRVADEASADYFLSIVLEPRDKGRFQFATVFTQWKTADSDKILIDLQDERRCWTQFCSVNDFVPPLKKSLARLKDELSECRD